MSKQVADALCMEDVTTAQFDGGVRAQLTREADVTEVILRDFAFFDAFGVKARQASGLVGDTATRMLTTLFHFLARCDHVWYLSVCRLSSPRWTGLCALYAA